MEKLPEMVPGEHSRCLIGAVLLGFAVFIAYANSFAGVFQFDDFFAIVENPVVHSWSAWWADFLRGGIRPLLKLSYLFNYTTGGLSGFHLFNVTLHFCNTMLVFSLSRLLLEASAHPARVVQLALPPQARYGTSCEIRQVVSAPSFLTPRQGKR